jgi:hypothetical protein
VGSLVENAGTDSHLPYRGFGVGRFWCVALPVPRAAPWGEFRNELEPGCDRLNILILLLVPPGYVMTVFEEQELIDRYGEEYRKYQGEVPRFIPRWRKTT